MNTGKTFLIFYLILMCLSACTNAPVSTPNLYTSAPETSEPMQTQTQPANKSTNSPVSVTPENIMTSTELPPPTATQARILALSEPPMQGEDVLALQQRLLDLGYSEVGADYGVNEQLPGAGDPSGIFDAQCEAALKHFQFLNHLEMSGELDAQTAQLLYSEEAVGAAKRLYPFPGEIVSPATNPDLIINSGMVDRLVELGYIPTFISPLFTPETQAAIEIFQGNNNLPVDGSLDYADWQQLFSPWAVRADGSSDYDQPSEAIATRLFPVDDYPNMLGWDGERLWVGHVNGAYCEQNTILALKPETGLLGQTTPIIVGDCLRDNNFLQDLIYAKEKLFLFYPDGTYEDPSPSIRVFSAESKTFIKKITVNDCFTEFCFPATAFGYDGNNTIWAASNDSAFAINAAIAAPTGISHFVGFMTSRRMAFDGKCMWMAGEVGVASFSTTGGSCKGANESYSLPNSAVVWDGERLWAADQDNALLYAYNPESGSIEKVVRIGNGAIALAFDGNLLWAANSLDNTIQAIHPESGSVGTPIPVGKFPSALLFDGKRLWISNAGSDTVQYILPSEHLIEIVYPTPTPKVNPTQMPTLVALPFERTLYLSDPYMQGEDVLALQQQLLALGYIDVGTPDGIFGPMTENAVMHFQSVNELTVDGIVGPVTWERLFGGSAWRP